MLLVVFGRVVQFLLMFITIKVSTTLLPPEELAKVFLVTSIISFYAFLLLNPVGMFINRRMHAWDSFGKIRPYYKLFLIYLLLVCVIAFATLWPMLNFSIINTNMPNYSVLLLVCGSLLFATVNQVAIPGLNMVGHVGWFVSLTLATAATSLAIAVLFAIELGAIAEYWMVGLLAGQALFAIIGWNVLFNKTKNISVSGRITKNHLHIIFDFAWPISLAVGFGWIQSQGYRFMMETTLGLNALGLFAAGYGISVAIISAFEIILATYFQPLFYKKISQGGVNEQSKAWGEYSAIIFPTLVLVGFFVLSISLELTHVMLGPDYQSAFQFIVWGVGAELARVFSGVYGMVAHARMNTKLLFAPNFVGGLVSIALVWLFMPLYGSNGVGAALLISSLIVMFLVYIATKNEFPVKLNYRRLVWSVIYGLILVLLAGLLRTNMMKFDGLLFDFIRLVLVGSVFVMFLYLLLRSLVVKRMEGDVAI